MRTQGFCDLLFQMNVVRLTALAVLALLTMPEAAMGCVPPPGWSVAKERAREDQAVLDAEVFYRGVIEYVDVTDLDTGSVRFEKPVVTIRRTRTLWGSGAPEIVTIPWGYLVACPLPSLMEAYWKKYDGDPILRPGWGVTVIGRREDFADRPERLLILIDGESETRRLVRRFQQLHLE